jgi:hypothetical protein
MRASLSLVVVLTVGLRQGVKCALRVYASCGVVAPAEASVFHVKVSGAGIFWIPAVEVPAQATLSKQQHSDRAIAAQRRHLILPRIPVSFSGGRRTAAEQQRIARRRISRRAARAGQLWRSHRSPRGRGSIRRDIPHQLFAWRAHNLTSQCLR